MEIRQDPNIRWLANMMTPPQKRDIQKYCEYHNDHGHWTEDYTTLRKEIEIFIQNGKLIKFLADEKGEITILGEISYKEWSLEAISQSSEFLKGFSSKVSIQVGQTPISWF